MRPLVTREPGDKENACPECLLPQYVHYEGQYRMRDRSEVVPEGYYTSVQLANIVGATWKAVRCQMKRGAYPCIVVNGQLHARIEDIETYYNAKHGSASWLDA